MATLTRDGLDLRYEVTGSGPALLLPQLNFPWADYLDLGPLAARFTVITASPRGERSVTRALAKLNNAEENEKPTMDVRHLPLNPGLLCFLMDYFRIPTKPSVLVLSPAGCFRMRAWRSRSKI